DVRRPYEMCLVHGERNGAAVDLTRSGKDDLHPRVVIPACLEDGELAAAVDFKVGVRVAQAVDVTHLAGEVEDDITALDQVVHRRRLGEVGAIDVDAIGDRVDVEQVAAVVRDERIDQQHVGAEIHQPAGEIAADEAEAASNHHGSTAIECAVRVGV